MKNTFLDLIKQSFRFPQEGFALKDGYLTFHGISLKELISRHGTPFKLIYLPHIGKQINRSRKLFNHAIDKHGYQGKYHYCYSTKCNHLHPVLNEALKHKVNLETSSPFDIDLILSLLKEKKIDKERIIIHNGYKTDEYLKKIDLLQEKGLKNSIIVLDNKNELRRIEKLKTRQKIKIGLRMAINEEAQSAYYTSRLGIRPSEIAGFFRDNIQDNAKVEFKMLHFFVDSGIKDTVYYWGEFQKALKLYIELKKECTTLDAFNLGGGFPIRNHLGFEYNYEYIIDEIIKNIKDACTKENVTEPAIYTEFGRYTVGESGAIIFRVLEQKQQNDTEWWYIIDNSLMNTIPDAWTNHEKFILLPINKWNHEYHRVNIGGISCDRSDFYNSLDLNQEILLPKYAQDDKEPLYLGFFHTGAYQDAISGYGGIKHCLIPSPKHVIIDRDEEGNPTDYAYQTEPSPGEMFRILGYYE